MRTGKCEKEKEQGEKKQGQFQLPFRTFYSGNYRKKMGNEKMWSIEENKMKKMGITRKVDWSLEKKWIYRVLITSCTGSNYRSCRHTIWFQPFLGMKITF